MCKRVVKKMKKVEMERIFLRESTFDDCEYFAKWEQMETVTPEQALQQATDKFIERFSIVESAVTAQHRDINNVDVHELDEIWEKIKHN